MLAKLRACCKPRQGSNKEPRDAQNGINFHEEYHRALRTKSYAAFFNKAQLLAKQPSIYNFNHNKLSEILLEPSQETIPSIVDTALLSKKSTSELKNLMLSYFDMSAEASYICSHILKSINQVNSNHQFIQRALDIMDDEEYSQENFKLVLIELNSFMISSSNPFSNLINNEDFKLISERHSSVLHHLKSMRKKVGKKIKHIKNLKKTTRICIIAAYGIVAITATVIAAHTLTALVMGPAILSIIPYKSLMKKLRGLRFSKTKFLSKVFDQLDIAAKGTYILNRDFDTMSRLVARLHDEDEHSRAMVQFCLDRKKEDNNNNKFFLEIVKELKKSDDGFRKQAEELEEHMYLCLVTINRARGLVIKEMMAESCTEDFGI